MAYLRRTDSLLVLLLFITKTWMVFCQNHQSPPSICQSLEYRALDAQLQNEHQCVILEKLQKDFEEDKFYRMNSYYDLTKSIEKLGKKITRLRKSKEDKEKPIKFAPTLKGVPLVRDCQELLMNGVTVSGVYPIKLPLGRIVNVWCDMDTDNGGWTVFQRRMDGSVNFTRGWDDYTFGFGNSNTEFWFGNDNLYQMTSYFNYTLRIDLYGWENDHAYAEYNHFSVSAESSGFKLSIAGYNGTAGDSLAYHNDMKFTTPNRDNDKWFQNCGRKDQAGWWYRNCGYSSLNGLYIPHGKQSISPDGIIRGIIWFHWKWLYHYSLRKTEMKLKPTLAIKIEREIMQGQQTTQEPDYNDYDYNGEEDIDADQDEDEWGELETQGPPNIAQAAESSTESPAEEHQEIPQETPEESPNL